MPRPVVLDFRQVTSGRGGQETVGALKTVREQATQTNATLAEQAKQNVARIAKQRDSLRELAIEYRRQAAAAVKGSEEQRAAIGLAIKAHQELGTAASGAAVEVQSAAKASAAAQVTAAAETQSAWARTFAFIRRGAGATAAAGVAAGGFIGGAGRREEAAAHHAEERGFRGALGEGTRELGFGRILGGPALVGGFIAGAGIAESIKLMLDAQQANRQLQNALKNTGESYRANRKEIQELLESQEKVSGFSKIQLTGALESLVRRTGSLEKAQKGLALATDLSRGAHISLDRAVTITTRAYQGNVGQLARLGISVPKVTTHMDELRKAHIKVGDANRTQVIQLTRQAQALDKQETATRAVAEVERKYHDAALTRSKTLQGRIDQLRLTFENWGIAIGEKVMPYATRFVTWIVRTIDKIKEQHRVLNGIREAFYAFVDGIATVVKGITALWGSMSHGQKTLAVVGGAFVALTAIMMANPFLALAAGSLIAIGLVRRHWSGISKWFSNLWDGVREVFQRFWDWIRTKAILAALDIVEPFSHLPGRLGSWARKAKDAMNEELDKIKHDAYIRGAAAGDAYGDAFVTAAQARTSGLTATGTNVNAEAAAKGAHGVAAAGRGPFVGRGTVSNIAVAASRAVNAGSTNFHLQGERTPYDCSAFVQAVFRQAKIQIGSTTYAQIGEGRKVAMNDLQPDDVVFFNYGNERWPGHVAIYVGDGMVVHDHGASGGVSYQSLSSLARASNHTPEARCFNPAHAHASEAGAGDGFGAGIAAAKANQPKPKPKSRAGTIDVTTVATNAHSISQIVHGFSSQLEQADLVSNAWEQRQLRRLDAVMSQIHKGMKPAELRALKLKEKEITDALGEEIDARVKKAGAAAKALAAFRRSLTAPLNFARGLIDAFHPGREDPTSAIDQAISGLGDLGVGPDRKATQIEQRIEKLYDQLATLSKSKRPNQKLAARIKQEIQDWGKALSEELTAQLDKATRANEEAQVKFDRQWRNMVQKIERAFDDETTLHEKNYARETDAVIQRMRADTAKRIQEAVATVNTMWGTFQIAVGGKTPAEAALDALNTTAEAENLQQALDDASESLRIATIIGEPGQIREYQRQVAAAQLAIDRTRLTQIATDERAAADKALQAEQDRIQAESDVQQQAYQDQRDAELTAWQRRRDDQRQAMEDDLDDWRRWLDEKAKSYQSFVDWLAQAHAGASAPAAPPNAVDQMGREYGLPGSGTAGAGNYSGAGSESSLTGYVKFATGGYVTRPTRAIVADDGAEFVVPESWLPKDLRDQVMNILAARRAPGARAMSTGFSGVGGGGGGGGGAGTVIYVNVTAGRVLTARDLAADIRDELVDLGRVTVGGVLGGYA